MDLESDFQPLTSYFKYLYVLCVL